jgi:hypothetical protein
VLALACRDRLAGHELDQAVRAGGPWGPVLPLVPLVPLAPGGPVGPLLGATPVPVTMTVGATAVSSLLAPSVSVALSALAGALAVNCTPIPHVSPGSSVSPSHSSLPVGIAKSAAFVPEIDAAPVNVSPIGPAF